MNRPRRSRLLILAVTAVLALGAAACSDDGNDADPAPAADSGQVSGGGGDAGSGLGGSSDEDDAPTDGSGSPSDPIVFGIRVTAEPDTRVEVESTLEVSVGGEAQEMTQVFTIDEEPEFALYTGWVESGEIVAQVTEGGDATVEIIRGHLVDSADPFEIEVVEVIDTIEVSAGTPAQGQFP